MIELGVTPTLIQPVILCGGSGTRLWPLSREHHPKPLHALNGERTLLQETGARCAGLDATVEPLVICNEAHRFMVAEQLRRIGAKPKAIVLEPQGRGTAPALTLAAVHAWDGCGGSRRKAPTATWRMATCILPEKKRGSGPFS